MVAGSSPVEYHEGDTRRFRFAGEKRTEGTGAFGLGGAALIRDELPFVRGAQRPPRVIIDQLGGQVSYRTEHRETGPVGGSNDTRTNPTMAPVATKVGCSDAIHYFAPTAFTTFPAFRRTCSPT